MKSAATGTLTLAIETANPPAPGGGSVAFGLVERGRPETVRILAERALTPRGREEDDLFPAIDGAAAAAGVRPGEVGLVAVSAGPGGYTAVRVACAAGKLIARGSMAMTSAVPSALSALAGAGQALGATTIVVLAGKRETAHVTVFRGAMGAASAAHAAGGRIMTPDEFAAALSDPDVRVVADAHLPQAFRLAAIAAGVTVTPPAWSAGALLRAAALVDWCEPTLLNPIYAREPEAVTLWRERKAGR